nr:copia-type polyprotein [Tanacetum cinerariifolium]
IDHPNQVCEGCLFGKHARSSFSKEAKSRAKEPLQLIHTDLCGLITPSSHEETDESSEEARQPQSPTPTQDSPLSSSKREPKTRKAMKIKKWRQAMDEEIKSIEKNDTWELTTLPKGQKAIGVK